MGEPRERSMNPRYVEVMDTTLRDGEQMSEASYTSEEKLTLAKLLIEEVRVDRVEIASALVSAGEEQAVADVISWAGSKGIGDKIEVLGFTDLRPSADWMARLGAGVMNILAKGSLNHLTKQLRKTQEEHVQDIRQTVEYAEKKGIICQIYLEDWSNGMIHSPEYVYFLIDELKNTAIRRFMLPDTLGVLNPKQVTAFVTELCGMFPALHFDFHAHNDYGLATANSLAAAEAGARGVHATVNGVGERAGNASLDEVVVGLKDHLQTRTGIDERKLYQLSETVEIFSGRRIAFNKPITGSNVFIQTSGIHADGDKKANLYASPLLPERFNRKRQYALGKLSGKSNLDYNLEELDIRLSPEQRKLVLKRIKELGDRKERITREDLPYIISDVLETPQIRRFVLKSCVIVSSMGLKPIATIKLAYRPKGEEEYAEYEASALGDGGYDAFVNALRKILKQLKFRFPTLADYQINIPPGGKSDALVQCIITWKDENTFVTKGVNSDQVMAAVEATEKMLNITAMKKSLDGSS